MSKKETAQKETVQKEEPKEQAKAPQEQAPLALLNLLARGVSMKDAKAKLGID